jgi:tripartite-type tricarboxylate transporter receptor subunit TctC
MNLRRRTFLQLAAGAAALPTASRFARAQTYPSRPVRIIVGFAAGGGPDIVGRLLGQWLTERFGQQFIVENRPGGGGNVAAEGVVRAPADGNTLLMLAPNNVINTSLYEKLNFDFIRDIAPIASITLQPLLMMVNPSVPARTVPEFIAYAKANPGKVNFASAGVGTGPHLSSELFKLMVGVDLVHVPYRSGSPAMTDLIGGQVQMMINSPFSSIEYVKSGKVRALAVTGATRLESLPDIPAMGEFVPGYESISWYGIGAPANTPTEIIERLNREINAGLADASLKERLANLGSAPFARSPAEFGKLLVDETEKWGKVIRAANIKPE